MKNKSIFRQMLGLYARQAVQSVRIHPRDKKSCLYCGKLHRQRGPACSAEHYRRWQEENPNQGRVFGKKGYAAYHKLLDDGLQEK